MAAALRTSGLEQLVDVATLLVSELVTNALLYAQSDMQLRVVVRQRRARVEVGDSSAVLPAPRHFGPEALTGRGLAMVELLASSWGADPSPQGKVVWFELTGDPEEQVGAEGEAAPPGPPPSRASVAPVQGQAREVRLEHVPWALLAAAQEHNAALLREVALLQPVGAGTAAGRPPGGGAPLTPQRVRSAQAAHVRIAADVEAALGVRPRAASAPLVRDLVLALPPDLGPSVEDLLQVLDEADDLARREQLLVRPALPEMRAFRRWVLDEVVTQVGGGPPTPWGGAAPMSAPEQVAPLAEIEPAAILEGFSDAVVVADDDNRVRYVNGAAERLLGWPRSELVGRRLTTIIPPRLRAAHVAGFTRYLLTGEATILGRPIRVAAARHDGSEVEVDLTLNALSLSGGRRVFVGALRDLSDRVRLERQMALTALLRATSDVAVLLGLREDVTTVEDAAPLVLDALGRALGWELGSLWMVDDQADELVCLEMWRAQPSTSNAFERLTRRTRLRRGVGLPGRVWATGRATSVADVLGDGNFPRASAAAQEGLHGAVAFPVTSAAGVLGVVEYFTREQGALASDLLAALTAVGTHLGLFVARARAEEQLRHHQAAAESHHRATAALARTLRGSLLPPHLPTIPGLEVAARFRGTNGTVVGGDFYDVFPLGDADWGVVVGDVCGKGAGAARLTRLAWHTVRAAAMHDRRPSQVLADLNLALLRHAEQVQPPEEPDLVSCTAVYAVARPGPPGAALQLSRGGHPAPLLLRTDGSVSPVGRPGTVLGPFPDPDLADETVDLRPGDAVVLYTDGVTEARCHHALFGEERLAMVVADAAGRSAAEIAAAVDHAVARCCAGPCQDDVAVLVLRAAAAPGSTSGGGAAREAGRP